MKNLFASALTLVLSLIFSQPALASEGETLATDIACDTCGICPAPLGICIFIIFSLFLLFFG